MSKNQAKHRKELRPRQLAPGDVGESIRHWTERWWVERKPWPAGVRFEDAARVEQPGVGLLPPRPVSAGMYGCAAALCADDDEAG
jgi:hypothetical protein